MGRHRLNGHDYIFGNPENESKIRAGTARHFFSLWPGLFAITVRYHGIGWKAWDRD